MYNKCQKILSGCGDGERVGKHLWYIYSVYNDESSRRERWTIVTKPTHVLGYTMYIRTTCFLHVELTYMPSRHWKWKALSLPSYTTCIYIYNMEILNIRSIFSYGMMGCSRLFGASIHIVGFRNIQNLIFFLSFSFILKRKEEYI